MMNNTEFIYTRYLYNFTEVKQSLFICLIEHKIDESLFWAFELYHSGFKETLFEYIIKIYNTIYKDYNSHWENILHLQLEMVEEKNDELLLGNIIASMCTKKYNLQEFCNDYLSIDVNQNEEERKGFNVELTEEYIHTFRTNSNDDELRNILKNNTKYSVRKEVNLLFNINIPMYNELINIYNHHWLYYCYHCPIWHKRIIEHNGKVNDETRVIIFEDDNMHETFYEKWHYDPDEQSLETKSKSIGNENVLYLDIKNFCKKFKLNMKTKTIKRSKANKN